MRPDFVVLYIVAGRARWSDPADRAEFLPGNLYFHDHLFAVAIVSLACTVGSYRGGAARTLYLARTCRS
jgi:hypothetical protein